MTATRAAGPSFILNHCFRSEYYLTWKVLGKEENIENINPKHIFDTSKVTRLVNGKHIFRGALSGGSPSLHGHCGAWTISYWRSVACAGDDVDLSVSINGQDRRGKSAKPLGPGQDNNEKSKCRFKNTPMGLQSPT